MPFCVSSSTQAKIGANVWLSASRKFISLHSLENIVGFEMGRCYGAGMISAPLAAHLTRRLQDGAEWKDIACAVRTELELRLAQSLIWYPFVYASGKRVFTEVPWPNQYYGEDHAQFTAVRQHPQLGGLTMEADDLLYVHRRHETNASVSRRKDLWQGVMPLPLGGAEAMRGAALVAKLLAEPHPIYLEETGSPAVAAPAQRAAAALN